MRRMILRMLLDLKVRSVCRFAGSSKLDHASEQSSKQQLTGSRVYVQIFQDERRSISTSKWAEQYQLLDSYKICKYSGGQGLKQRQGDFEAGQGFIASA